MYRETRNQNDINSEESYDVTLEIDWDLIDDSLIDMLATVLNSKTKFILFNWNSLNDEKVLILDKIFNNFLENDFDIEGMRNVLTLIPSTYSFNGYKSFKELSFKSQFFLKELRQDIQ